MIKDRLIILFLSFFIIMTSCYSTLSFAGNTQTDSLFLTTFEPQIKTNDPPFACFTYTPSNPFVNQTVNFDASCSSDSDGSIIDYSWSYLTVDSPHFPVHMGNGKIVTYVWNEPGTYEVTLKITDDENLTDESTKTIVIATENQAPNTPNTPIGPTCGEINRSYSYHTTTVDNNSDLIFYRWKWDDNVLSEWTGPYVSNEECESSHTWRFPGVYQVCVQAKDEHGKISAWSQSISVSIYNNASADLETSGSLHWIDVKPKTMKNGSFYILNNGVNGSQLKWKIISHPNWGQWNISPSNGSNLTPEAGLIEVTVEIMAPNVTNKEFSGSIIIVNIRNTSDFEIVDVSLATPKSHSFTFNFLQSLFKNVDMRLNNWLASIL